MSNHTRHMLIKTYVEQGTASPFPVDVHVGLCSCGWKEKSLSRAELKQRHARHAMYVPHALAAR